MSNELTQSSISALDALSQISAAITTLQELDPLLEKIMDIAVEVIGAERGFVLLSNDDSGFPVVRSARNMTGSGEQDLATISNSVVQKVLQSGQPLLAYDIQSDENLRDMQSIVMYQIKSVACVPMKIKERPIGAIYLDSIKQRSGFIENSMPFLTTFANQAAIAIENSKLYGQIREENRQLRKEAQRSCDFAEIIGQSSRMRQVFDAINSVLDSDATVMIQGESGTGKELVARAIHYHGVRRERPFVAMFFGSMPESLLESELFGHKRGSFTGAVSDKKGLFESADHGTFFLDEIGDIPQKLQTQLLRVLQEGEIKRVGENHIRKVDVRIIAATNKNLQEKIRDGSFREDLYYRLNVINIHMPGLRERRDDIPLLAQHFLMKYAAKYKKHIHGLAAESVDLLFRHNWPGNVRELENTINRAIVLAKGALIGPQDLKLSEQPNNVSLPTGMTLENMARKLLEQTLHETGGNVSHAAARLGVSRRWVQYKQKQWQNAEN